MSKIRREARARPDCATTTRVPRRRKTHAEEASSIVVGSELDLEPRLFTCTRAADGRSASGTIVRLVDAVCFEKCLGKRRCELCEHERGEGARQTSASF